MQHSSRAVSSGAKLLVVHLNFICCCLAHTLSLLPKIRSQWWTGPPARLATQQTQDNQTHPSEQGEASQGEALVQGPWSLNHSPLKHLKPWPRLGMLQFYLCRSSAEHVSRHLGHTGTLGEA